MYAIQNRMKRSFIIPPVEGKHKNIPLSPMETALVDEEHWDTVKHKNTVIDALLSGRHLVVTASGKEKSIEADETANPASPVAPADVTEKVDGVTIESKVEVKEFDLGDEPAEATPSKRK